MSRALIGALSLLAGCSSSTQPEDVAVAEALCRPRGGYTHVARYEHGRNLILNCKDGTYIDVRLPDKGTQP